MHARLHGRTKVRTHALRSSERIPEHFPAFMIDDVSERRPNSMPEQVSEHCVNAGSVCQDSLSIHVHSKKRNSSFASMRSRKAVVVHLLKDPRHILVAFFCRFRLLVLIRLPSKPQITAFSCVCNVFFVCEKRPWKAT